MSVRDFLNKGIYIDDLNVASGTVPEAAPTLVTDGFSTVLQDGIVAPFTLGIVDLEAGVTPTATINMWGYSENPAAGSELLSSWQLIDSVTVDEATETLFLVPTVGFQRFDVKVNAITGAPTSVRIRLMAISPWTAMSLAVTGALGGIATNVNLIQVAGTNILTGGVAGSQGIGGLAADGAAAVGNPVPVAGVDAAGNTQTVSVDTDGLVVVAGAVLDGVADSGNPVPIGAVVDEILSVYADGDRAALITDTLKRLRVRAASYDDVSIAEQIVAKNGDWTMFGAATLADVTNGTDGTYYYYVPMDLFQKFAFQYDFAGGAAGAGVVMTVEATVQDDGTAQASCAYEDVSLTVLGAANITVAGGATGSGLIVEPTGYLADCKYFRIKLVTVSAPVDQCDWTLYLKKHY